MKLDDLPPRIRRRLLVTESGCWSWQASRNPRGYGLVWYDGKTRQLHRVTARLAGLPVDEGVVDHLCHTQSDCDAGLECPHRACANPAHMQIVGAVENVMIGRTAPARNLAKERCPAGHEYSHTNRRGWRKCRTCENAAKRRRRRELREG